jgi:hypothetical protein
LLLCGALALSAVDAPGAEETDFSAASRVIDAARIEEQLASLSFEVVRPAAARLLASGQRVRSRELRAIVRESIASDAIREHAIRRLADGATPTELAALEAWFASPLGASISRAEANAAAAQSAADFLVFLRGLGAEPPTARRAALVRELERATEATAGRVRRFERTLEILLRVSGSHASPRLGEDARAAAVRRVIATLLFTYRGFSDDELSAYLSFLRSGAARALRAAVGDAIEASIDHGLERAAPRIVALFRESAPLNASSPAD